MKFLKKNQVIVYVIALMLVAAGYLNYTTDNNSLETSSQEETNTTQLSDIGDATLVNSNDIVTNNLNENELNQTNEKSIETNSNTSENDYFVKSKLERDTMYSQMIETYEKVLNSSNSLETQKQTATEEITKINQIKNSIMICENLISTKGFENNIIFVNEESISVIISSKEEVKQEQIAQIQNIISREMNAKIENIHISTK